MFCFWGLHILIITVIIEIEEDFFLIEKNSIYISYKCISNDFLNIIRNKKCRFEFEFKNGHEFTVNS